MSQDKIFRIDWYPSQAYMDFSRLTAEEVAVLIQVINLIYMNQGPIENCPKWISRGLIDMGSAKCRNIINKLIQNGDVFVNSDGKISKKMCENQLKTVTKRKENAQESGKKGAEIRHGNEKNQQLRFSDPKNGDLASISISNRTRKISDVKDGIEDFKNLGELIDFKIDRFLDDNELQRAKAAAPGWDMYNLMRLFDEGIRTGKLQKPKYPARAFISWCAKFTEGKNP